MAGEHKPPYFRRCGGGTRTQIKSPYFSGHGSGNPIIGGEGVADTNHLILGGVGVAGEHKPPYFRRCESGSGHKPPYFRRCVVTVEH